MMNEKLEELSVGVAKWALWIVALAIILFVAYTWLVLTWNYSSGERAGYVQKLSKKGWLCKTWEGEMALISMPGTVAEKFTFTVRSDKVAAEINATIGRRVRLVYEQHIGIPTTCFGETQYFIVDVAPVTDDAVVPGTLPSTPPH